VRSFKAERGTISAARVGLLPSFQQENNMANNQTNDIRDNKGQAKPNQQQGGTQRQDQKDAAERQNKSVGQGKPGTPGAERE
jgi:hypothetical protein